MDQQEAADNLEILTSSPASLTSNEISLTVEALNSVVNVGTLNAEVWHFMTFFVHKIGDLKCRFL